MTSFGITIIIKEVGRYLRSVGTVNQTQTISEKNC